MAPRSEKHLPVRSAGECARVLRAMGDETRLRIVALLLERARSVGDVAEALGTEHYHASRHLGVLRSAGLVLAERDAQRVIYALHPDVRAQLAAGRRAIDLGCCAIHFT